MVSQQSGMGPSWPLKSMDWALGQARYRIQRARSMCSGYQSLAWWSFSSYWSREKIRHWSEIWWLHRRSLTTSVSHWCLVSLGELAEQTSTTCCQHPTDLSSCSGQSSRSSCWCCSLWDGSIWILWDQLGMARSRTWQGLHCICKPSKGRCLSQVHTA